MILEKTYANRSFFELEVPGEYDPAVIELVRKGRIYCNRQSLKFHHQFEERDGKVFVKIKMRDPRPYTPRKT